MKFARHYILILIVIFLFPAMSFAQEKEGEKAMTRAQVIEKLSASDFIKKKIGALLNWGVGYDITKINRTNLAPTIKDINITPLKAPPDDRTVISLTVRVDDPGGLANVRGVRADLSSIGRLPNMMLVDDGLWGDEMSNDGTYTLQTSVSGKIEKGVKDIPVAVSNKKGWVAVGKTNVNVKINPVVVEASASPRKIRADGTSKSKLTVRVENPGRIEDIKSVTVNLNKIGYGNSVIMYDDATHGDAAAGDSIFTLETAVKPGTSSGEKKLRVVAVNLIGGKGFEEISLVVE
ncbi:choice-of-anchor X domain-containing protein [Candidatus Margulisiibacteriota bacterium]